jgi:adenylate cyclase
MSSGWKWSEAAAKFVDILVDFPEDGPSKVFLERTMEFSENAPEGEWDGVYVMKRK